MNAPLKRNPLPKPESQVNLHAAPNWRSRRIPRSREVERRRSREASSINRTLGTEVAVGGARQLAGMCHDIVLCHALFMMLQLANELYANSTHVAPRFKDCIARACLLSAPCQIVRAWLAHAPSFKTHFNLSSSGFLPIVCLARSQICLKFVTISSGPQFLTFLLSGTGNMDSP